MATLKLPPLSKTEWILMNHCWRMGRSTARQVYEQTLKKKKRDYRTVKTLLDRIAVKGYLRVEKLGPLCLFTPVVKRSRALARAIEEFTATVLDDTLAPLFLHLANEHDMTEEEIETLRKLLDERGGKGEQ